MINLFTLLLAIVHAAPETTSKNVVKDFFPTGTYRKISTHAECADSDLAWRDDETMTFGSGSVQMAFHAFDKDSQSPAAKDACIAKTSTKISQLKNNKEAILKISEKITQTNCGSTKSRIIQHEMTGKKHHNKIDVTVVTKDSTRPKPLVCKYEKSLP